MKKKFLIGLSLMLPLSETVVAETAPQDSSGFYIGAGFGSVGFDDDEFSDDLGFAVGRPGAIDNSSDDTSLKIIAGYQFNNIVAIEASYTDYGDTDFDVFDRTFMTLEIQSFSVSANLGYSFDNGLRPFAIIGLSSVKVNFDSTNNLINDSDTGAGVHYGVGVDYSPSFMRGLALRLAYEGDLYVDESFDDSSNPYFEDEYFMDVGTVYGAITFKF